MDRDEIIQLLVYVGIGVCAIILGICLLIISELDYQDQIQADMEYARAVCDGKYPNYRRATISCSDPIIDPDRLAK